MITRQIHDLGLVKVIATVANGRQAHIVISQNRPGDPAQAVAMAYEQVGRILSPGMQIVHERIFGTLPSRPAILAARAKAIATHLPQQPADTPVTYLQGMPLWNEGLAGIQIQAMLPQNPADAWTIRHEGAAVGRGWNDRGTTFVLLHGMHGMAVGDADNSRDAQAARMFERTEAILREQGLTYKHVARTWIYLAKILDWYGPFNVVRNRLYTRFGLMDVASGDAAKIKPQDQDRILLPASTGIEGYAPSGGECAMDVLAVKVGPQSNIRIEQMTNRAQQDAFRYGSAFSRGACINNGKTSCIQISGTASIDEQGRTIFLDDGPRQIETTLDKIQELIAARGATLSDLCNVTVFFKRREDVDAYRRIAASRGLENLPAVYMIADVCRDDLLFEIDGTVIVEKN